MRTTICGRCGGSFTRGKRDPDVWCAACEKATADAELHAVLLQDRSGIVGLHETMSDAATQMREDIEAVGMVRLMVRKVTGQSGARSELREQHDDVWDHLEDAQDRSDFQRTQEMYR